MNSTPAPPPDAARDLVLEPESAQGCHVCGANALDEIAEFRAFRRVTSDCRPWPAGGRLHGCRACGCIQKTADPAWTQEGGAIYADYQLYDQAQGAEPAVFGPSGLGTARSVRLVEELCARVKLATSGRLLDIGCGNGATLRAFRRVAPGWSLVGTELRDKDRREVEAIEGVECLHVGPPEALAGTFDMITMIHVLEHIPAPVAFLTRLQDKLAGGRLLVAEVPDYRQNPFDLLIADHCLHLTPTTAARLLRRAGYTVEWLGEAWVPKELTLVARASGIARGPSVQHDAPGSRYEVEQRLRWLRQVVSAARRLADAGGLGLFGTAIAATWLWGELDGRVGFFVDEDPHRAGATYLGCPVFHPRDVPGGSQVFLALPVSGAAQVRERWAASRGVYHLPPECEGPARAEVAESASRHQTGADR